MPRQDRVVPTHSLSAFIFAVLPAIATVLLNVNAAQVFLFGPINNLYNHACVYAHNELTGVVAAGVCSAKYYLCFGIRKHFMPIIVFSSNLIRISILTFRKRISMPMNTISS